MHIWILSEYVLFCGILDEYVVGGIFLCNGYWNKSKMSCWVILDLVVFSIWSELESRCSTLKLSKISKLKFQCILRFDNSYSNLGAQLSVCWLEHVI
jgi:hypothetical protein